MSLLASVLSVKQEIKSSMENEVNRGKEGHFFRGRKRLNTTALGNERETSSWTEAKARGMALLSRVGS